MKRGLDAKPVISNFVTIVKEKSLKLVEPECCMLHWYHSYLYQKPLSENIRVGWGSVGVVIQRSSLATSPAQPPKGRPSFQAVITINQLNSKSI